MSEGQLRLGPYDVNMVKKLGQGGFGTVYAGKHRSKGTKVAVKKCGMKGNRGGEVAMSELRNIERLQRHPHIIRMHYYDYRSNALWIVMDFCDKGDLQKYFKSSTPLKPFLNEQINLMFQSASAIEFMHAQRNVVVHRDIKPGNILVKRSGGQNIVKVTDFGLSKISDAPDPAKTAMFTTAAGTPAFMAPELFEHKKYDKSVDVFSLGLVFLAMINFKPGDDFLAPERGKSKMF